jgi:glycosyltransferase involved in cell wall biosynthesis
MISVIIPVFNSEQTIIQSVRSILNQSYKNIEIILINDGSFDSTLKEINKIKDDRLKIFSNKKNMGIVYSLNKAINKSNGEYIARMDADDVACKERLKDQLDFLKANKIDLCGTGIANLNRRIFFLNYPKYHCDLERMLIFRSSFYHPTILAKRKVFKKLSYSKKYEYAEDYALWVNVVKIFKVGNLNKKLLLYRTSNSQISMQKKNEQKKISNIIKNDYFSYLLGKNFDQKNNDNILLKNLKNKIFLKKLKIDELNLAVDYFEFFKKDIFQLKTKIFFLLEILKFIKNYSDLSYFNYLKFVLNKYSYFHLSLPIALLICFKIRKK